MAQEILPVDSQGPLTPFQDLVYQQVLARGDDNHPQAQVNRFNDQSPPARDYDYLSDGHTGEIGHGDVWQTHHLDIENLQLVYAFKPPTLYKRDEVFKFLARAAGGEPRQDTSSPMPVKAEFYVYEFGDRGVSSRTEFSEYGDVIHKSRASAFGSNEGLGLIELSEKVGPRKRKTLESVIAEPEADLVALRGLVRLTIDEQRKVRKAQKEQLAREQEYRDAMDALDRANMVACSSYPEFIYG